MLSDEEIDPKGDLYLTTGQKVAFIRAYAKSKCNASQACKDTGISWVRFYRERLNNAKFRQLLNIYRTRRDEDLKAYLLHRMQSGFNEPVFWQGQVCGYKRRYETQLAELYAKMLYTREMAEDGLDAAAINSPDEHGRQILQFMEEAASRTMVTNPPHDGRFNGNGNGSFNGNGDGGSHG